jgi:hypothetical protein
MHPVLQELVAAQRKLVAANGRYFPPEVTDEMIGNEMLTLYQQCPACRQDIGFDARQTLDRVSGREEFIDVMGGFLKQHCQLHPECMARLEEIPGAGWTPECHDNVVRGPMPNQGKKAKDRQKALKRRGKRLEKLWEVKVKMDDYQQENFAKLIHDHGQRIVTMPDGKKAIPLTLEEAKSVGLPFVPPGAIAGYLSKVVMNATDGVLALYTREKLDRLVNQILDNNQLQLPRLSQDDTALCFIIPTETGQPLRLLLTQEDDHIGAVVMLEDEYLKTITKPS